MKSMKKVLNGHAVSNETMNCTLCDYYSSDCLVFEAHKILYHSEKGKELYCEDCSYHTSDIGELSNHIRKHYKFVDCPHCSFKGLMRKGMEGHLKKVHPNLKAYKCDCCNFSCKTKKKFQKHMELHSDKFQCADCNLYFTSKHILKKHVLLHLESNRAPYKCGKCDLTFSDKFCMKVHNENFHSNKYTCNTCNSKFNHKGLLTVHMKMHSEVGTQKIIKCEQCGLVFARKNYLTNHLRFNHLPEFYKCQYCPFECNESSVFSKHNCVEKISDVQKLYSNLKNVESSSEISSRENLVQEVSKLDESVSNNNEKKIGSKRGPYKKKVYEVNRQKVLSLRSNLPSRRSQATLDNQPVIGSKILKGARGGPRKPVTQKKQSVPFNCKEPLFGKDLSPKQLFVEPLQITNENYTECFYQSDNPSALLSHIETHVRPRVLLYCQFCLFITNLDQLLQTHMTEIHSWDVPSQHSI